MEVCEFVNFSIAKKLKEKGFNQNTCAHYRESGIFSICNIETNSNAIVSELSAPTISQVLKWLREEKEIYIVIQPFPTMSTKNKICWCWSFKWHSDGEYIDHTFADDMNYTTYEQAALAGIEYVLDNLI